MKKKQFYVTLSMRTRCFIAADVEMVVKLILLLDLLAAITMKLGLYLILCSISTP